MNKFTRPSYITIGDSSTVVVRGVSALLKDTEFDPFLVSPLQRIGASALNHLPSKVRKIAMEFFSAGLGVDFKVAEQIKTDELTGWVVSEYPKRKYDCIIVGAPSGGVGHLASLVGAPFLTQHFLFSFRGHFPIDNSLHYLDECRGASETILRNNPDLSAIIHYDPIHDRFLVKKTGYVRVKLLNFPQTYRRFLKESLNPNGTIILIGCQYPWLQYEIADRLYYQLGGLGGVTPQEYYDGSERIENYIKREKHIGDFRSSGFTHRNWLLKGYEPEEHPESEWGLIKTLADDVRNFATMNSFKVVELELDHPDELSEIVFNAFGDLIKKEHPDRGPRIFLDSFTNSSPAFNRKVSARPLWLPFICDDSFEFACRIMDKQPENTEILLALHPTFSDPFDLTSLESWQKYLVRFRKVRYIAVNPRAYPTDLTEYFRFSDDLKKYSYENPCRLESNLTPSQLIPYIESVQSGRKS